jgi:hypothetical protein
MRKHRAALVVVLFLLFAFGVARAEIEFAGVLEAYMGVALIDSITLTLPDTTLLTPGWGSQRPFDTCVFAGVPAWPETLRLHGAVWGQPLHKTLSHPKPDTWYYLSLAPEGPFVMFYGDYGVEELKPLAAPLPRLTISPSVVTEQMTVRLQPIGTGRPVVEIHDAVGNVVRSLGCTAGADGVATATWNREDEFGRPVPEGVYFCRHANADVVAVRKVLVAR